MVDVISCRCTASPTLSRPSSRSMNSNIVCTVPGGRPISARRSFNRCVPASRQPRLVMNAFHTSISSSLGWRPCRERPREQLLIAAALERFRFERRVIDVEELAAAPVETPLHGRAARRLPALGQFPRRREPDLVQHPAEIDEAVDLIERAAKSGNDGWIRMRHA